MHNRETQYHTWIWCLLFVIFFLQKALFWFEKAVIQKEGETEKEILSPLVHLSKWPPNLKLSWSEDRSFHVFHRCDRAPGTLAIFCCLSRLNAKRSSQDMYGCPHGVKGHRCMLSLLRYSADIKNYFSIWKKEKNKRESREQSGEEGERQRGGRNFPPTGSHPTSLQMRTAVQFEPGQKKKSEIIKPGIHLKSPMLVEGTLVLKSLPSPLQHVHC